jgi:hypothetical protein
LEEENEYWRVTEDRGNIGAVVAEEEEEEDGEAVVVGFIIGETIETAERGAREIDGAKLVENLDPEGVEEGEEEEETEARD